MVRLMPKYCTYLREHPHSVISRVYGLFTITTIIGGEQEGKKKDLTKYHVYMQRNVARLPSDKIYRMYDLKGSIVNR